MRRIAVFSLFLAGLAACGDAEVPQPGEPFTQHGEASDLVPYAGADAKADGLPPRFDPSYVIGDAFFVAHDAVSAADIQAFFEATPYGGRRSWLADEYIGAETAAEAIARVAKEVGVNPIVLIGRMQVEKSLVSKTPTSRRSVDWAFGCGCPDGRECYGQFKGLDKQLACAGETLRTLYDASVSGEGQWRAGHAKRSLDPEWITPANHATASLYGYTPWVLRGRGGNWLVWNVTRKFADAFAERVELQLGDEGCLNRGARPFVGDACGCAADCAFAADGQYGTCHPAGFCTLGCQGYCPDLSGRAPTFCVKDPLAAEAVGICVPKAHDLNGGCADLEGTLDRPADRFIGESGASARSAVVCLPVSD